MDICLWFQYQNDPSLFQFFSYFYPSAYFLSQLIDDVRTALLNLDIFYSYAFFASFWSQFNAIYWTNRNIWDSVGKILDISDGFREKADVFIRACGERWRRIENALSIIKILVFMTEKPVFWHKKKGLPDWAPF